MSGYRGDGYGQYGNVGDDDFRWGEEDGEPRRGAARGNLMGRAERETRSYFVRAGDRPDGDDYRNLADDPRAVRAADEWRERHGREGYEGSYARHDETYLSYRERHLAELDEDYAEYCRENGHEFSGAFENWRRQRQENSGVPAIAGAAGSPEVADNESPNLLVDESSGVALDDEQAADSPPPPRGRGKR